MIDLTAVSEQQIEQSLCKPGSFGWWYLDICTSKGDGLVLIWAVGLPFFPGSRDAEMPLRHPSLHLASYRRGKAEFYHLQEFSSSDFQLRSAHGSAQLANNSFHVEQTDNTFKVLAELDLQIPHSKKRLQGTVQLRGPQVELSSSNRASIHQWTPRSMHASGNAQLSYGEKKIDIQGPAYFDGNLSQQPLHTQPIERWLWGRMSFNSHSLVYYLTRHCDGSQEQQVLRQWPEGKWEQFDTELQFCDQKRGKYGTISPRKLKLHSPEGAYELTLEHLVDDGPFYQRFVSQGSFSPHTSHGTGAQEGCGISEVVLPQRVDVSWQRPFIRMKTQQSAARNSVLLPFFTGFSHDRLQRLSKSFLNWGQVR